MSKGYETRQRLLDSAQELMYSRSYSDVGVQEICKDAKVQKGSFYHFFPSKSALTVEVLEQLNPEDDEKMIAASDALKYEMPDTWQPGDLIKTQSVRLLSLKKPSDLVKKFPFPGGVGNEGKTELRDRPAYYYTQSSVIPYRWTNSKLQVMIVSSSKNKHWVVPKGIVEPGLSPQLSAAKEAEGIRERIPCRND